MKKVDNMQDWIGNLSREVENIKKNHLKMLEIKYTITDIIEFVSLTSKNTSKKKIKMNLKICQQKLPKQKHKEKQSRGEKQS